MVKSKKTCSYADNPRERLKYPASLLDNCTLINIIYQLALAVKADPTPENKKNFIQVLYKLLKIELMQYLEENDDAIYTKSDLLKALKVLIPFSVQRFRNWWGEQPPRFSLLWIKRALFIKKILEGLTIPVYTLSCTN